jgi:hypothetical protein
MLARSSNDWNSRIVVDTAATKRPTRWSAKVDNTVLYSPLPSPSQQSPIVSYRNNHVQTEPPLSPQEIGLAEQFARLLLGTIRGVPVSSAEVVVDWSMLQFFKAPHRPADWPWQPYQQVSAGPDGWIVRLPPQVLLAHALLRSTPASSVPSSSSAVEEYDPENPSLSFVSK